MMEVRYLKASGLLWGVRMKLSDKLGKGWGQLSLDGCVPERFQEKERRAWLWLCLVEPQEMWQQMAVD